MFKILTIVIGMVVFLIYSVAGILTNGSTKIENSVAEATSQSNVINSRVRNYISALKNLKALYPTEYSSTNALNNFLNNYPAMDSLNPGAYNVFTLKLIEKNLIQLPETKFENSYQYKQGQGSDIFVKTLNVAYNISGTKYTASNMVGIFIPNLKKASCEQLVKNNTNSSTYTTYNASTSFALNKNVLYSAWVYTLMTDWNKFEAEGCIKPKDETDSNQILYYKFAVI